jgi:hypothetical protein
MKKILYSLAALILSGSAFAQTTNMKIILDTKKFTNLNCGLNADGLGGPSPLTKVYMHSGVCWYNGNNGPTDFNSGAAELYCIQQISPLNSEVWQSVVGNWGANPQDDGVGEMVNEGNGVFSRQFVVQAYFSSPEVNLDTDPISGITSMPMNPQAVPHTMGLVFRDATGTISGRDPDCNDIFIWKLTSTPEVVTSLLVNWVDGPVSFEYGPASVNDPQIFYDKEVYPNPFTENVRIKFFLTESQNDFEMNVFDAMGRKVKSIYRGALPAGTQFATWDGTNDQGVRAGAGVYYFNMRAANANVTDRIVMTK